MYQGHENIGRIFPSSPWSSNDDVSGVPALSRSPSTSNSSTGLETPRRSSLQRPLEEKDVTDWDPLRPSRQVYVPLDAYPVRTKDASSQSSRILESPSPSLISNGVAPSSLPPLAPPIGRTPPKIYFLACVIKALLSTVLVSSLIVGYTLQFKVFSLGIFSLGLYGIILITDFTIQLFCACINRVLVNRVAHRARKDPEFTSLSPDMSICVVGYRENDRAWRKCLQSLQQQTLPPRTIIAVVDGHADPDFDMAHAFDDTFKGKNVAIINLPILLSTVYKDAYTKSLALSGEKSPNGFQRIWRWLKNSSTPNELLAHQFARDAIIACIQRWEREHRISSYDAVCFLQPHGHKRTAMFTSFAIAMYAYGIRDAIFTTDSDTILEPNALEEMIILLNSDPNIGGVTADVKIWNRYASPLAYLCGIRYWFSFNIERACQSFFSCVTCLSGPMSLYRSYDLDKILGPWSLQRFGGQDTTFGDDRHLTNQLLAHGLKTKYTHRTYCQSESPTTYVRWVKQQTRWSKSFFREAFWFPIAFGYHWFWLTVETTKQSLYPFILISTVIHFLYFPTIESSVWAPIVWLCTMVAVAFVKSVVAVIISRDLSMLLFSFYGILYFWGLLPSKIYAILTIARTTWGTSARSSGEMARSDSFLARSFHVGHLVIWYGVIACGIAYFCVWQFENPVYWAIAAAPLVMSINLYFDFPQSFKRIFHRKKRSSEESHPLPEKLRKPRPRSNTTDFSQ